MPNIMEDTQNKLINESKREIGELRARCEILESRVASLTALAYALLKNDKSRDVTQTTWANALGPALQQFGPSLEELHVQFAASIPGWIQHKLNEH